MSAAPVDDIDAAWRVFSALPPDQRAAAVARIIAGAVKRVPA